jgi:hypothetical protein
VGLVLADEMRKKEGKEEAKSLPFVEPGKKQNSQVRRRTSYVREAYHRRGKAPKGGGTQHHSTSYPEQTQSNF